MKKTAFLITIALYLSSLYSAFIENQAMRIKQPNGAEIECYASGDEYFNYLHDKDNYTIIQSDKDGFYYYAVKVNGKPVCSQYRVNSVDPRTTELEPRALISKEEYLSKRDLLAVRSDRSSPSTGTVNNITIMIKFADQTEFDTPRSLFYNRFNSMSPDTLSMRSYYDEVSYNQLNIMTSIYPICNHEQNLSYTDSHPRAYYSPYNAVTNPIGYQEGQRTEREHLLLKNAVEALQNQIPASLNIDGDNDYAIDNICFIIRGQNDAWADLLWAHKWSLFSYNVSINGIAVDTYTFQPEQQNTVRTLSHEMFHSLGAPDLYHYEHDFSTPVGVWDIMERSAGHMLGWMKYKYASWIEYPETISPGMHTIALNQNSANSLLKIQGNNEEFFVLEYRNNGFGLYESTLPESGLLLYRINPEFQGNAYNGDEIYVYRKDGTLTNDGNIMDACANLQPNNSTIGNNSNPVIFYSNGNYANFTITVLSMDDQSLTFLYSIDTPAPSIKINSLSNHMIYQQGQLALNIQRLNNTAISELRYYLDNEMIYSVQNPSVYNYTLDASSLSGWHTITAKAYNSEGVFSADSVRIDIRPAGTYWYDWMLSDAETSNIAPGVVPFQVAVHYNLSNNNLHARKIKMRIALDPAGVSDTPGLVSAKIVRTDNFGYPSNNVLVNLGTLTAELDGDFEYEIPQELANTVLNGPIALQLDLPAYHMVMVDTSGYTGYTWRTNSGWDWKNLCSYGVKGTAMVSLQLSNSATGTSEISQVEPVTGLINNYPNPFNPETSISFNLGRDGRAVIEIFNVKGQIIRTIETGDLNRGVHTVSFNGKDDSGRAVSSGIYFYRLKGSNTAVRKMLLLK